VELAKILSVSVPPRGRKDELIALILEGQARRLGVERTRGVLDVHADGFGFLRRRGDLASEDVYVSPSQIRRFELRRGDLVVGLSRPPKDNERYHGLIKIESVNGREPDALLGRPLFERLTPVHPCERFQLAGDAAPFALRQIDLFCPIGKGQRAVVLAPPGAGEAKLLVDIATAVTRNHPETHVFPLLVDVRPEDVTAARRAYSVPISASSFGEPPDQQAHLAELTFERAKRVAELGGDALLLVDTLGGLVRAYDATHRAKRLTAAARRLEEGGSLTIIAAAHALSESDLRIADFIESANATIVLAPSGTPDDALPEIDVGRSWTRHRNLLLGEAELRAVDGMRRAATAPGSPSLPELVRQHLLATRSNDEFVQAAGR